MTKREFLDRHKEPVSVRFHVMDLDDFLLGPLPNHLFTRDTSAWIYDGGVSINAMRWPARQRETVHFEAIYRHHPLFTGPEAGASTTGPRGGRTTTPPPSRAATSSSSATAPCSSA